MSGFLVSIDAQTLARVHDQRAAEWRSLAADLAEAVTSLDDRTGAWTVADAGDAFTITSGDDRIAIPRADLDPLFEEYLDVVTRLGTEGEDGYTKVDALDMAKKVTHDRGGRVLKRMLRPLGVDHEVARRVFSLLAAIAHDTSRLTNAHAALARPNP